MRTKSLKIITALLLSFTLCLTPALGITSNAVDRIPPEYNADIPYIHVVGLMTSDIYEDPSDPDSETVWPPQTGSIVKAVFKLLPAILRVKLTRNYDKFGDTLIPALNSVLSPAFLSTGGDRVNKTGARLEYPDKAEIKPDSKLWFDYDWRIDPYEVARELNDYINYVLDASGCEQVVLECHSYGGVVTYTYAALYGTEKVRSFLFNASAVYGETFTGDLCQGKLVLDPDALTEYLKGAFADSNGEKFLNGLFAVLNRINITDALCNAVNRVVDRLHDRLYAETILPMFGNWPSIWTMVTDEMYDDSFKYIFDGFYASDGVDHSAMREKVERFDKEIRKNRVNILNSINETSDLYVVCRYGYCSMFCTPSWKVANDMIVDVKCASFGATAAPYGEQFAAGYLAGKDEKLISPGKNIDASTCLFPEQTWFIRDYMHMKSCPNAMFETLLYSDGQATVDTYPDYPRFMLHTGSGDLAADK